MTLDILSSGPDRLATLLFEFPLVIKAHRREKEKDMHNEQRIPQIGVYISNGL